MKNKRAKCKKSIAVLLAAVMVVLLMPWSSFAGENARAATGIGSADWKTAKLGTQSDGMVTPVYDSAANKLTLNTKAKGKMANTGQSGFEIYYTKVKSKNYNFTIRGRFHTTSVAKQDNQSSFGLAVLDTLGAADTTADYINQLDVYAATKSEATGTTIPGVRLYTGNSDATGKSNAGGSCDVTQYFDQNATVFTQSNATQLYYNFELVKDGNGYVCNWYNDDWSNVEKTITVYNPNKFLQQDSDYVYVGFYASRIGTVEVTDLSYEQHTPTQDELDAVNPDLWVEYDEAEVHTFNGTTTADEDYTYRFTSNVTGTVSISDNHGNQYYTDKEIKKADTVEFKLSDFQVKLPDGDTTFTAVVTPYENAVNADGSRKYDDRLLLKDYSPVTVTDTVTKDAAKFSGDTIYVSAGGNSKAAGTKENPTDIYTAVSYAKAGQTILLQDGTYNVSQVVSIPYSVSGNQDAVITMKAENAGKAVLNGAKLSASSDAVLSVKGNYWKIQDIAVAYASDGTKGVHVSGNHNVVEQCEMYRNGSTGLQISYSGGEPKCWWPSDNTILNCTSYSNCDSKQNDADGFAAKLSVGEGNVFDGCMAYNNADDGYDLYAKSTEKYGPIGAVTIQNSVAYSNGLLVAEDGTTSYSAASANGFKLGGEGLTGKHVLKNCISWNNGGSGIMSNNGPDCQVYQCISVDNGLFSRVGGTADRNNYQLTPKNGDKFTGDTGYVLENSISFYTDAIENYGTMAADKFTLKNQDSSVIYKTTNYLCNDISTKLCVNTENKAVEADWFTSVDYKTTTPARNEDGSINMNGLFEMTDKAPAGIGADFSGKTPSEPEEPTKESTVWVVGDSTVCSFADAYYYPRYGWGTQLANYFDSSLKVENLALSGRSSKSFTTEDNYKTLMDSMTSGDYLLVGFGHNDEKAEDGRYTDPNGAYTTEGSFANSLYENYVKPAQEKGVTVILCTPIVRRTATGEWSSSNLHITSDAVSDGKTYAGGDYAEAVRKLGADTGVAVVDMTTLTKNLYDSLGADETLNLHSWTSSNAGSVDNTHTNIYGARYNAYMLTQEIKKLNVAGIADHILSAEAPVKSEVLKPNPDYKEADYKPVTGESTLWKKAGIWSGSVFGNVGGNPSTVNQTLETDADGNIHIAVRNNKGKIAGTADGIAMYYYKVPASSSFTLTAKATINSFDSNDQVSFGLMARDDMYLDKNTTDALGDYVAAGPLKLKTGAWNCFARKSGVLTQGGTCTKAIAAGDTIDLKIESNSDGYACTFGQEETVTGGFDFKLTTIDSDYVYVGMYVARKADVTFSDVKLIVDGKEVTAEPEQPSEPEQPTTPSEPTTPEQPTTPSEPTTPEQPTTPTETKTTVTVNGSGTVTVPETVEFVGADGGVLKNTKLILNIVKEGQAYVSAAQQMKAAIEKEMPETLKNSSVSYLEMNLTDEAGQTVTFKNGKLGITLEYPAGTGKSGYSFAVLHLTENGLETLMPQLTDNGLYVEVSSFSPFAVVYQAVNEQPTTPSEPEQPTTPTEPTTVQPTTAVLPTQTVQPSTEGSAAATQVSDAQTEDTGVATADTMRAVPFVLMMFVAMTAFVVLAGRKKKEVR